jgi:hypothetical protein
MVRILFMEVAKTYFVNLIFCCMMHLLLSLLRIKGLYMFRALLAHPQEVLQKLRLVYCVRVMSVGCIRIGAAN